MPVNFTCIAPNPSVEVNVKIVSSAATKLTAEPEGVWLDPKANESGYINLAFAAATNKVWEHGSMAIEKQATNGAFEIVNCTEEVTLSSPIKNGDSIIPISLKVEVANMSEEVRFQLLNQPRKGKLLP